MEHVPFYKIVFICTLTMMATDINRVKCAANARPSWSRIRTHAATRRAGAVGGVVVSGHPYLGFLDSPTSKKCWAELNRLRDRGLHRSRSPPRLPPSAAEIRCTYCSTLFLSAIGARPNELGVREVVTAQRFGTNTSEKTLVMFLPDHKSARLGQVISAASGCRCLLDSMTR
jgi:hypothetical protein